MTSEKIQQKLDRRGLAMIQWPERDEKCVVWLFAPDDPGMGVVVGEAGTPGDAVREAFADYDQQQNQPDNQNGAVTNGPPA